MTFRQINQLLLIGIVLLNSCAIKNGFPTDFGGVEGVAPTSWSESKDAQKGIDTQWVSSFSDPELTTLINSAWNRSLSLQSAIERVNQSLALVSKTASAGRPQAELRLSGARNQSVTLFLDPSDPISTRFSQFQLGMNVIWELDFWGRVRNASKAEISRTEAEFYDVLAVQASLAAQVAKSWFSLKESIIQTSLTKEQIDLLSDEVGFREQRLKSGQSTPTAGFFDLNQVKSEKLSLEADLIDLLNQQKTTARNLNILTGEYPSGNVFTTTKLPKLKAKVKAGLPSELLLRRPDILQAERLYVASVGDEIAAQKALYPRFSLTSQAGTQTSQLRSIINSDFGVWSLGGNVTLPLLAGGELRAEIRQQTAIKKEALANLHQTVLEAFEEVENTLALDDALLGQIRKLEEASKVSEKNISLAERKVKAGTLPLLDFLSLQRREHSLKSRLVTLRTNRLLNRVDLHLALGGDYKLH